MNKVILSGNIARDVELKITQSGKEMVYNCIAVYGGRDNNGNDITHFINFVAYGNNAKFIAKYLQKGNRVGIEAHITTGTYTNRDGQTTSTVNIVVDSIENYTPRTQTTTQPQENPSQNSSPRNAGVEEPVYTTDVADDDLPF